MSKRPGIWTFVVLLLALSAAWGQDDAAQQPEYVPPVTNPQQPTLPSGMDNITPSISENPPISGVDLPSVGPHSAPLSYLQAGGHLSETVDSNIQNALGGSNTSTISVALGSLELQRLWSNYDLALDYLGGVGYYYGTGLGLKQIEELGANQKVTLETRAVRNSRRFQLPARGHLWQWLQWCGFDGRGFIRDQQLSLPGRRWEHWARFRAS